MPPGGCRWRQVRRRPPRRCERRLPFVVRARDQASPSPGRRASPSSDLGRIRPPGGALRRGAHVPIRPIRRAMSRERFPVAYRSTRRNCSMHASRVVSFFRMAMTLTQPCWGCRDATCGAPMWGSADRSVGEAPRSRAAAPWESVTRCRGAETPSGRVCACTRDGDTVKTGSSLCTDASLCISVTQMSAPVSPP